MFVPVFRVSCRLPLIAVIKQFPLFIIDYILILIFLEVQEGVDNIFSGVPDAFICQTKQVRADSFFTLSRREEGRRLIQYGSTHQYGRRGEGRQAQADEIVSPGRVPLMTDNLHQNC